MSNLTVSNSTIVQDSGAYLTTLFVSGILLSLLSPITVASNALLLTAIYKDPFKCFRSPVTLFIVSLAVVDFLTGLIVEPCFAIFYLACYVQNSFLPGKRFTFLLQSGAFLSTILLSSSFLLVLAMTTTQYIAITYPHKYKTLFTKRRVLVSVMCFFVYFTIFSSMQFTDIPKDIYYKVDLVLHPTVISVLLAVSHVMLYRSFLRFARQSNALQRKRDACQALNTTQSAKRKESKHQKQLTVVALFLSAILLLCSLPHLVVFYVYLYATTQSYSAIVNISIALRVSDMVMFFKVAIDAYIYAWRHPKYRRAVQSITCCYDGQIKGDSRDSEQEVAATGTTS